MNSCSICSHESVSAIDVSLEAGRSKSGRSRTRSAPATRHGNGIAGITS